ncbi:MAG: DHH family phosphoesterase [Bacteroidetes bacterium B1(2017)]|nr:MAG: DHH family phosphoesterase [Bacteroidetes bacterium B1(2017)]
MKKQNNISQIKPLLEAAVKPRIVITTHHKPDADALGSSLGLYNYLAKLGIQANVVTPTDYGDFLKWMPGENSVINFEEFEEKSADLVADADLIFCLDFNALKRINNLGKLVEQSRAEKVLIDHHLEPEGFEDYRLWTTKASSTSELIFWLIELMGHVSLIDEEIASCLYAGVLTDTASFKHPSTTPTTHRVAAMLLEKGAKSNRIYEAIYDNYSESRTRFIGYCLSQKLQILKEYNTALIVVNAEELKQFQIITGDSEGLVNYGLSITGMKLSVLIIDRTVARKMSFRSRDTFPANEFARKYFNGGGHFNAAGGESGEALELVEAKFKEAIKEYKNLLN